MNFWKQIKKPVIGLAPADGITDAAFRHIVAKYGQPSVIYTEFVPCNGLVRGIKRLLEDFIYSPEERPIVAQVFGAIPENFYKMAIIVAELGFDGIDINMGCPDKSVTKKQGAGAALIDQPQLAGEIVKAVKKGISDWTEGKEVDDLELETGFIKQIKKQSKRQLREQINGENKREPIPVSIKTRIGVNQAITEEWIKYLLETQPQVIAIHGRTLKQLYKGKADWGEIGKATAIAKGSQTKILGNGDINSYQQAVGKIKKYGVDGVLIGRGSFGNPWIFRKNYHPSVREKLTVMIEQAQVFNKTFKDKPFIDLRKHFGWYCRGFPGAKKLREKLVRIDSLQELTLILSSFEETLKPT